MRIFAFFVMTGVILASCSSAPQAETGGELGQGPVEQISTEVGLPPELSLDDSFELVFDSTIENTFAQTIGIQARPVMMSYESGLFFLVLDYAPHQYFPLQGGTDLRMAVSTDGQDWAVSDAPVFNINDGSELSFRPYSMLRMPDGTYVLYGAAHAESVGTIQTWASQYAILRATAANPMEGWILDPNPLLLPGDAYSWDRMVVWSPYVFDVSEGFYMYYWGQPNTDFNADNGVGIALSNDGIVWQKTRPDDGGGIDETNNLLLSRSEEQWVEIILLHVWRTQNGWQLMYYLRDRRDSGLAHLAFSQDGVEWESIEGDVQLPESTTPDDIIYASLVYAQDHYWIMYCVGIDSISCYLARSE